MQGFCDPFNRAPYHVESASLRDDYRFLGQLRETHAALRTGAVAAFAPALDVICILRTTADGADAFGDGQKKETFLTVINRADKEVWTELDITDPGMGLEESVRLALIRCAFTSAKDVASKDCIAVENGVIALKLPPCSAKIYQLG